MDFSGLLETAIKFVGDEQFFGLLATAVATLWAWGQRKIGVERKEGQLTHKALSFLEAGVAKTYQEYVKVRKQANEDGKLTAEEAKAARVQAFETAKQYALNNGVDLVKSLGADMIPVLIEKTVGGLKKEASGPTGTGNGALPAAQPAATPSVNHPVNADGYGGPQV